MSENDKIADLNSVRLLFQTPLQEDIEALVQRFPEKLNGYLEDNWQVEKEFYSELYRTLFQVAYSIHPEGINPEEVVELIAEVIGEDILKYDHNYYDQSDFIFSYRDEEYSWRIKYQKDLGYDLFDEDVEKKLTIFAQSIQPDYQLLIFTQSSFTSEIEYLVLPSKVWEKILLEFVADDVKFVLDSYDTPFDIEYHPDNFQPSAINKTQLTPLDTMDNVGMQNKSNKLSVFLKRFFQNIK